MKPNPKKVALRSQQRIAAKRVANRYAVTEHATPEAREKHLKEYPNSDPSNHVVKEKEESGSESGESKMRRKPTQRPEKGKERARRRLKDRKTRSRSDAEDAYRRQKGRPSRSEQIKKRKERFAPKRATEFPTQKALDNHLKKLQPENRADAEKRHTVKKNDSGSTNSDSGDGSSSIKMPKNTKPSKGIQTALETEAGRKMVSTITDKEKSKSFAKRIAAVANPKNIIKTLSNSSVREVRNVVQNTPTILMDCIKEGRKPSSEKQKWPKGCDKPDSKTKCSVGEASERDILYGSAVYAGGIGVATALSGGTSVAAVGVVGTKAFLNSLTLHIGLGAASEVWDKWLLHAEVAQDAMAVAGGAMADAVSNFGTGTIDGLGSLFETVFNFGKSMLAAEDFDNILQDQELIRVANEGDAGKTHEKFVQGVIDYAVAKLEKGLTEEEIKSILEHGG